METSYLHRYAEGTLTRVSALYPVLLISGARQTGKTTLARHHFSGHRWVFLDSAAVVDQGRSDPGLFLANNPPPVIFDEVQRVPELFRELKSIIDTSQVVLVATTAREYRPSGRHTRLLAGGWSSPPRICASNWVTECCTCRFGGCKEG